MEGSGLRKFMLFICLVLFALIIVGIFKVDMFPAEEYTFKVRLFSAAYVSYILIGMIYGLVRFNFVFRGIFTVCGCLFGLIVSMFVWFLTTIGAMIMLPIDIILTLLGKPLAFPFED